MYKGDILKVCEVVAIKLS